MPTGSVTEMFDFDAAASPSASEKTEEVVGEIFSLDPDAPIAKPQAAVVSPPALHGGADIISLDLDDQSKTQPDLDECVLDAEPVESTLDETPIIAEIVEEPTTVTKPAKNGRPEIKITMLRPGQTSPLGQ